MSHALTAQDQHRNWRLHALEGGIFEGSLALVGAQTLIPAIVHGMGGPGWIVGLVPVMMQLGYALPTLLTAPAVAALGRFHPIMLRTGIPLRLPYLATGVVLLGWGDQTNLCLTALVLTPFIAGLCGGVNATAWPQLVARTIAPERRASLFAVRFVISASLGILAGALIHQTLTAYPGPPGYGRLYLGAFFGLMVSYGIFAGIREPAADQPVEPSGGIMDNLRRLPALLREDPRLRILVMAATLQTLSGAIVPYLGIQACRTLHQGDSILGTFISAQMAGSVAGGLIAGWAGDRWGGRRVVIAAQSLSALVSLTTPWLTSTTAWSWIFALVGASTVSTAVGMSALQLELLPERGRANWLAILSTSLVSVAVLTGAGGGWAWDHLGPQAFFVLTLGAAAMAGLNLALLRRLHPAPVITP